jgi:hypothetical protein
MGPSSSIKRVKVAFQTYFQQTSKFPVGLLSPYSRQAVKIGVYPS